jgi:hypothetical protein
VTATVKYGEIGKKINKRGQHIFQISNILGLSYYPFTKDGNRIHCLDATGKNRHGNLCGEEQRI